MLCCCNSTIFCKKRWVVLSQLLSPQLHLSASIVVIKECALKCSLLVSEWKVISLLRSTYVVASSYVAGV